MKDLVTCQHCGMQVIPTSNGSCPSCGKQANSSALPEQAPENPAETPLDNAESDIGWDEANRAVASGLSKKDRMWLWISVGVTIIWSMTSTFLSWFASVNILPDFSRMDVHLPPPLRLFMSCPAFAYLFIGAVLAALLFWKDRMLHRSRKVIWIEIIFSIFILLLTLFTVFIVMAPYSSLVELRE